MAIVKISSHIRGRKSAPKFPVSEYTQNRRDGKKRKRKGYTACQTKIAEQYTRNMPINATQEALRTDPAWRNYICNCQDSKHYALVTGQELAPDYWYRDNPEMGADYTYQAPNWGDPKKGTHPVTIRGRNVQVNGFTIRSKCGVDIQIPSYRKPLSGREILKLGIGA